MSLKLLEEIAREAESKLHDRYTIGYTRGLMSAVLVVRTGGSLEELINSIVKLQLQRCQADVYNIGSGKRDAYDLGYVDALVKAKRIMGER